MAKTQFHACAKADLHINEVDNFYYNVRMAQTDLKIRSPNISVDSSGITPEILREIYFTKNPDYAQVYLDFDVCCENEADFREVLAYLQKRTDTFSDINIRYITSNYL